jgi:hypothetical protein
MKFTAAVLATALAVLVGAWLRGLKPCPTFDRESDAGFWEAGW